MGWDRDEVRRKLVSYKRNNRILMENGGGRKWGWDGETKWDPVEYIDFPGGEGVGRGGATQSLNIYNVFFLVT